MGDSRGRCLLRAEAPISLVLPGVDPTHPVRCSQIQIDKESCDMLDPRQAEPQELRRCWLALALTLVHEAGHAIAGSSLGSGPEQFYEDCPVMEMGFTIEQQLFGGILQPGEPCVALDHICSPHILEAYRSHGRPLPQQSASPADAVLKTLVGDDWIASLFKVSFWEGKVVESNGFALRPPYRACFCLDCLGCIDDTALILTARQMQLLNSLKSLPPLPFRADKGPIKKEIMRLQARDSRAEKGTLEVKSLDIWKMRDVTKDEEDEDEED